MCIIPRGRCPPGAPTSQAAGRARTTVPWGLLPGPAARADGPFFKYMDFLGLSPPSF